MKRIEDIAELKTAGSSGAGRKVGNLYWLAKDLREFIDRGRLYTLPSANGLGVVLSNSRRNQFCFRVDERNIDSFDCSFEPDTTYVSELVFPREHPERCDGERRILTRLGFRLHSKVIHLAISREAMMSHSSPECAEGYSARAAVRQDAPAIEALLCDALDPVTDDLELGEDLIRSIESNKIWVAVAPDGAICGCLVVKYFGKNAWFRHMVIAREHRGLKLTDPLNYRLAENEAEGTVFHIWVKKDNAPSLGLVTKFGFTVEPREMEIWIR